MAHRTQRVQIGDTLSDTRNIYLGVPQGSIGGPLLFNIYINDIFDVPQHAQLTLFADDDTTALFVGDTPQEVEQMIETDMARLATWFRANGLSMNWSKTGVIQFLTPRGITTIQNKNFTCEGRTIDLLTEIKFLGVYLDKKLTFEQHTKHIRKKICSGIAAISRTRKILPHECLLALTFRAI